MQVSLITFTAMQKNFLALGIIFALLAVVLGAFGAHALKARLSPDQIQVFETGVKYQFYHAFALIITVFLIDKLGGNFPMYAGWCFVGGICLFSGSLYMISCKELVGMVNWRWLGPITPLGGLCFIAGWLSLLLGTLKTL